MNARLFKLPRFSSNIHLLTGARHCSTATRPPVLLLGEAHSRPAAIDALFHSLKILKGRGYNMFMSEGIEGGNTLVEAILNHQKRKASMEVLYGRCPALIKLIHCRYQLTQEQFETRCMKLLNEASLPFNNSIDDTMALIGYISRYCELDSSLYNQLISMGFSFENLDKNYSASIFRPTGGRWDLNFRDEEYVNIISQAYEQGKNVISIVGCAHVLPKHDRIHSVTDKVFGLRQLMGDRLRARGIPCITLFPFNSSHTTVNKVSEVWEQQYSYSTKSTDPTNAYSVNIEGSNGIERFLNLIDALSSTIKNQTLENNLQTSRQIR